VTNKYDGIIVRTWETAEGSFAPISSPFIHIYNVND
jgi:hypothetical protein